MKQFEDTLVIHFEDPHYCSFCDKTFGGYTAHYCEGLMPDLIPLVFRYKPVQQWIKDGNHT